MKGVTGRRLALPLCLSALLSGCGVFAADSVPASRVHSLLSKGQCAYSEAGLHLITQRDQWDQLPLNRRPLVKPLPYPVADGQWVLLVAMGRKPTPGFGLNLVNAESDGETLNIRVSAHSPAPGMVMAQMITEPCLILSVPQQGWQKISISGAGPTKWSLTHP